MVAALWQVTTKSEARTAKKRQRADKADKVQWGDEAKKAHWGA